MGVNVVKGFTVFACPIAHRRRFRTSNFLERLSQEIKPSTRIVRVSLNEWSCQRLIAAILMETNDKLEYETIYLKIEPS